MGRGSGTMIFVIYWECISLRADTRVGESYNWLGIYVVVMLRGDIKSFFINL